ncbi:MAG TPA: hypothetical protein PLD20_33990 [Blastocatellia bacterium]|nr:hypothetical protein [Blastocatellia bacterium]HMV87857.1 hypothetical protein [Blastocatellia bacterium]HMY76728.1 hypothetical protein [Blastocatellia bacterium]HMZ22985.1 hypothetical protein [Blastocatellia bacterium]HNG32863.1 hypothetical protein [Blastocatellia bacterium]
MRHPLRILAIVLACGLVLAASALAQSGRKQKKAETQPPPQGVNQPETRTVAEPEIAPEKPKEKEKGPAVMVSTSMPDLEIPSFYADTAREACANEFRRELKTIEVHQERNQHRSDAMKAAKDEDNTYVVWIELSYNRMGGGTMNGLDMRYTVFEPKTARIAGSGFGYPTQPMGMPVPPLGASRDQVYVDWAGRDIAQQVIKRLNLRGRP